MEGRSGSPPRAGADTGNGFVCIGFLDARLVTGVRKVPRSVHAAITQHDDDAEAAEPPSPFRMMVAPGALKRAAAAHARSLSLVEAANKAHEDAGGVVEYRRYG